MVLRKQKEGAGTCRFSVDLQNGKTIRIPLIWYNTRKRCQKASGYRTTARSALGVDPGIANCGYAVVSRNQRGQFRVLDAGCIKQDASVAGTHRLLTIAEKIEGYWCNMCRSR